MHIVHTLRDTHHTQTVSTHCKSRIVIFTQKIKLNR